MVSFKGQYPLRRIRIIFPGLRTILIFFLLFLLSGCEKPPPFKTLDDILKTGEITVITRNNSHSYYHYRDQAMGFEHDLAAAFAEFLGVNLNIKIAEKWENMIPLLEDGSGALIAASMTITPKRQQRVTFSKGYLAIRQHLIVHRSNRALKSARDLAGKTVHVRKGTSYQELLETLKAQGIGLKIKLHEDIPTEELIQQVAEKKIEVTVADSNIAFQNRRYYPRAIVADPISGTEYLGWAVHPDAQKLLERINDFFREIKSNGLFDRIYNQYYADIDHFDYVDLRAYHRRLKTRLPKYRPIIKSASKKFNFDWRLITAQMYQESHFDPEARSHAGAYGLMQITRPTAKSLGVKDILEPRQNIHAGVQHLNKLYNYFDQYKGSDRLFVSLAAYNIGQGHIMDARRLAKKMKLDPNKWSSLAKALPLLRYRKYYKGAVYGYCRGTEPLEYTKQIMIYYDILRHQGIEYRPEIAHVKTPPAEREASGRPLEGG